MRFVKRRDEHVIEIALVPREQIMTLDLDSARIRRVVARLAGWTWPFGTNLEAMGTDYT